MHESGMAESKHNWTFIGVGIEVLAGLAVAIHPVVAVPFALIGAGLIWYGWAPHHFRRLFRTAPTAQIPAQTRPITQPSAKQKASTTILPAISSQLPKELTEVEIDKGPVQWFFADVFDYGSGTGFWVTYFKIAGKNTSGEPLTDIKAYIVAKNNKKEYTLGFRTAPNETTPADETHGIPPGADFTMRARIVKSDTDGKFESLNVSEYLDLVGGFDFWFSYNNKFVMRKTFEFADIKEALLAQENHWMRKQEIKPPTVKPKTT